MNLSDLLGLAFILVFFGLMMAAAVFLRQREEPRFREIQAFIRFQRAIGLAVEAGSRLHLSLGRGHLLSTQSGIGYVGLSILNKIARSASISDRPPIATSGEGTLGILSQDTQRSASEYLGVGFDPMRGRVTGLSPYPYAAGTLAFIQDENVGANMLIGSYGNEVALITEAAERSNSTTLGGTDNISGQAILFASAEEPLIGEETYAGGAYLGVGLMHNASLYAQDILRWVISGIIVLGAVLKLVGLL